jgi:hypothetical protein
MVQRVELNFVRLCGSIHILSNSELHASHYKSYSGILAQKLDSMSNIATVTQAGTGSGSGLSAFKGLEITASISPYSFASFALMKKSPSVSCTIVS